MISFGRRLSLAFSAWFSIVGSGELPEDVDGHARQAGAACRPSGGCPPPPAPAPPDPGHRATQVLALLQRDGRLVDFLMEDLTAYDDAQIGAAVRDVHAGSRQALQRYFTLEPVLDDEEGRPVTLERNVDPARVKVVGNVAGICGDSRRPPPPRLGSDARRLAAAAVHGPQRRRARRSRSLLIGPIL